MANSILGGVNPSMVQQIKQFGNTLQGDPKQMVMNMLQQGQISNAQLQNAMQTARQFQGMIK